MSIIRLIISVLVSVPIAQGIWLLVAGFFGEKFIGPLALLALPMTLAFLIYQPLSRPLRSSRRHSMA